jgi:hypothetical protein
VETAKPKMKRVSWIRIRMHVTEKRREKWEDENKEGSA